MSKDVHISEIKNYLKCKLLWYWTAPPPRGLGLTPIYKEGAQNFGSLTHEALQHYYDFGVHPAFKFKELFLAQEHSTKDQDVLELGQTMLDGYVGWAAAQDRDTQVIAAETEWHGVRIAPRITLGGIFDKVVRRSDGLWIMDFKTTRYRDNDWTMRDLQATAYTYAARQMYGPGVRGVIFRFLLKKAPLTYNDLILKNGTVTTRSNLKGITTLANYHRALAVAVMQDVAKGDFIFAGQLGVDPKVATLDDYSALLDENREQQEWYAQFKESYTAAQRIYYPQLQELGGPSTFFWDIEEHRTDEQVSRYMKHVIVPASKEMISKSKKRWVGPTGLGAAFAVCSNCKFKHPCRLVMDGADYRTILREEYSLRDIYREEEEDDG